MTKNEQQNLEALKIGFENTEWKDFLLVLNEIRNRDKEIIAMYRHRLFRFTNGCNNAINELELPNYSNDIAIAELKKVLSKEENYSAPEPQEKQQPKALIIDGVRGGSFSTQNLKEAYTDGFNDIEFDFNTDYYI